MTSDASSMDGAAATEHEGFVAPPERVQIVYRPRRAPEEEIELPLRLLVLGDFRQRPDPRELQDRRPIEVTKQGLDKVMAAEDPSLSISVPSFVHEEPGQALAVTLRFRRLADLHPEAIAGQVPELQRLREARAAFTALKGPLGGELAFRNAIERRVSDPASRRRLQEEIGVPIDPDEADRRLPPELVAACEEATRATDADALERLSRHWSIRVKSAVARNPSTPFEALAWLSARVPTDVAENPALPLHSLVIPRWASQLSSRCMAEIQRLGTIELPHREAPSPPVEWLRARATDGSASVRASVAASPDLPADLVEALCHDTEDEVRMAIARRRDLPRRLVELLAADRFFGARMQIARSPTTPLDLLTRLADDVHSVRIELLGNPAVPAALREQVIARNREEWRALGPVAIIPTRSPA